MATLTETAVWTPGIYQLETDDPVEGGPNGIDNQQAKELANRTAFLKQITDALPATLAGKQPQDATLTALAALVTAADKLVYATGVDTFATTTLSAFIRTLLDDADATAARTTLGAAALASPTFTGTPAAPTAVVGTNTTQLATTAFVQAATAALVAASPAALDTLNELAAALGDDANFATTMTNALAGKQPLDATLTALAALVTAADKLVYATGADTFATATLTAFARTLLDDADAATARTTLGAAALASPVFTGTPAAPTAVTGTNTTQLATTAFVQAAVTALVNASPAALDTLAELAAALGNDANFATTVTNALAAISVDAQEQAYTAFTSAGAAPAFTLTPIPAIAAYAANQRFRVKFHAAGTTGTNALNVSGLGAKSIKQYDAAGVKVPGVVVSGQLADLEYDGADFVILDPLPALPVTVQGAFKNLNLSAGGLAASVSVSYDELVLGDGAGSYVVERNVASTITTTVTGAGGLDTGALAASTWYSIWRIGKTDGTLAFLFSLSATAPTMPGGYTLKARIGSFRTDGSANKYPLSFVQYGRRVQYKVAAGTNVAAVRVMALGVAGTYQVSATAPTWVAIATANYVPPTASKIHLSFNAGVGSGTGINGAPNNQYAGPYSTTNPCPVSLYATTSVSGCNHTAEFLLESASVYWASNNASNTVSCLGWEDNL